MDLILGLNIFLKGTALVVITTEGISIYENLGEIGVKLPFHKYFIKLEKDGDE